MACGKFGKALDGVRKKFAGKGKPAAGKGGAPAGKGKPRDPRFASK